MTRPPLYIPNIPGVNSANIVFALSSSFEIVRSLTPPHISEGTRVLLPGNGSFGTYTSFLRDNGWYEYLFKLKSSISFYRIVAICSGFQSLCESSSESLGFQGMNLYPFKFESLRSDLFQSSSAINLGRSETNIFYGSPPSSSSSLFIPFDVLSSPYYVHGYASSISDLESLKAQFDLLFTSSIDSKLFLAGFLDRSLLAVQFHPELSGPFWRSTLIKFLMG